MGLPKKNDQSLIKKIQILEDKLRASRLREADKDSLLKHSPDILYRTNLQGIVTYISPAVTKLCGYTVEEAIGMHMANEVYVHPEARKDFLDQLQKYGKVDNFINQLKHKNGSIWWGAANAHLFFEGDGKIAGVEGVVRDVTEQMEMTQALKVSEERYRLLYETAGFAIGYWSPKGRLISLNRIAEEKMKKKLDDCKGKSAIEIYGQVNGTQIIERITQSSSEHKEQTYEDRYKEKVFLSTYNRIQNNAGEILGVQIISADLTDQKKTEKEHKKLIQDLRETLSEVKELRGLIPICASCKKIRDDSGYWGQIESYIEQHSQAVFSHGMCPDCMEKTYGDKRWFKKKLKE